MSARDLPIPAPSGMVPVPADMSPECMQALRDKGLEPYAFPGNRALVMVYRKDSRERLFDVTSGIDARDLRTLLSVYRLRCLDAYERGREAVRADLRHMLGVQS